MPETGRQTMHEFLRGVAVGPAGSRDLNEEQAFEAMQLCLNRKASDVQIAVFLIAERMKRETFEENLGFLRALISESTVVTAQCPRVVNLADPYDGFNRTAHFAPVVAAVLGACGLPAICHGALNIPPKYGTTARDLLTAAGIDLDIGRGAASVEAAAEKAALNGASYVDLEDFCPALTALTQIRKEIAKRPALSTLEKLVTPIRAERETHVVSGWVHAGYEILIVRLLKDIGISSALMIKGREGHIDVHTHRPTSTHGYSVNNAPESMEISPEELGLTPAAADNQFTEAITADSMAQIAVQVLEGSSCAHANTVCATAATILHHTGIAPSLSEGTAIARRALSSRAAKTIFYEMGVR
jgi:anthranilate phosphoribosyltransferase